MVYPSRGGQQINKSVLEFKRGAPISNDSNGTEFVYTTIENFQKIEDFFAEPSINEELKSNSDELYCNCFTIKIKDDGPGISKEGIKNLFIDFQTLQENQD